MSLLDGPIASSLHADGRAQTLSKVDVEAVDSLHLKLQAVVQQQARHARSVEECVTAMTQDQVALHKEVRPSLIPQEVFTRSAVSLTVSATRVSHCASLTASLSLSCGALQARTLDGAVAALRRCAVDHHHALLRATHTFASSLAIPSLLGHLPHPLSALHGEPVEAPVPS